MGSQGIDQQSIQQSVDELRAADLASGELKGSLRRVVDAIRVVFAADGAGVMLLDDQQALHYVGATDGRAAAFEAAQEETGEGPCVDSLINDTDVATDDLVADSRWPLLTSQISDLGVRAVLGVPLRLGPTTIGSLNVYYTAPHPWHEGDVAAVDSHARIVEELLGLAVLSRQRSIIVDQLTQALENRVMIERAVGVIMATTDLDAVRAFNELRLRARSERRRVSELAEEVLLARRFDPR